MAIDNGHDLDALATLSRSNLVAATSRCSKRRINEAFALVNVALLAQRVGQVGKNAAQYFLLEANPRLQSCRVAG